MDVLRFLAPLICILLGLYGLIWALVASSYQAAMRIDGVLFGIIFLLLATAYLRIVLPAEQRNHRPVIK